MQQNAWGRIKRVAANGNHNADCSHFLQQIAIEESELAIELRAARTTITNHSYQFLAKLTSNASPIASCQTTRIN